MRSPIDADDLPYLAGVAGGVLVVVGVAQKSASAALVVAGGLLLVWAWWRIGGRGARSG